MKLENNDIRELLNRYWEGQTSIEEERRLKEFFAYGVVPEELLEEANWFRSLVTAPVDGLDDDFDAALLGHISGNKGGGRVLTPNFFRMYWKAAAAVLLIVGMGSWAIWSSEVFTAPPAANTLTEAQPSQQQIEEAYEQTRNALFMISSRMNHGKSKVKELGKFEQATEQVKTISND